MNKSNTKKHDILLKIVVFISAFAIAASLTTILLRFFTKNNPKTEEKEEPEISLADKVYEKLKSEDIDKDFLKWVDKDYAGSLEKLNSLLENSDYNTSFWHQATGYSYLVLNDIYNKTYDQMDNVKILSPGNSKKTYTLSFTGDVSLADNWHIAPKYDQRGGVNGILGDSMLKTMKDSDLTVVNSEFTVSTRGTALPNKMYTFRAKPERLKIYDEMGVDMVTLANNHVYDYGKDAFLDMLAAFEKYEIPHIGAGRNITEAKKPYYFIIGGYKFVFVAATRAEKNIMTPKATEKNPGTFWCYDPTDMINQIKALRSTADFVVPIIHFGRENSHDLETAQVKSAKAYIDAGADIVVGHHAHVLQGVEIYKNKPIIYNLGNFLFNNLDIDTALFQIVLDDNGNMEYYMLPALQSGYKTSLVDGAKKQQIIKDLNSWSVNAKLDQDGKITKK